MNQKLDREFKCWLIQEIGMLPVIGLSLWVTMFVGKSALVQKSASGYVLTLVSAAFAGYWIWLQYFLWKTQATSIKVSSAGIRAKPLLDQEIHLSWDELVEVGVTRTGYFIPPQVELRSRTGSQLRVPYLLPQLKQFLSVIHEYAPQCRIDVPPVPIVAIPDSWK